MCMPIIRSKSFIVVCVCVIFAVLLLAFNDATAFCLAPPVIKQGARPQATFRYRIVGYYPVEAERCIDRAFSAWNDALLDGSQIQFLPAEPKQRIDVTIFFTDITDIMGNRGEDVAGGTTPAFRDEDGYVTGFGVMISTNPELVSSCDGYYKVTLHEIGHGLGLGHPYGEHGTSVMNMLSSTNDDGGNVATFPTACDIEQIETATAYQ